MMEKTRTRIHAVAVAVAAAVVVASSVSAQQQSRDDGVVLHEYFEPGAVAGPSGNATPRAEGTPSARSGNAGAPPGLTLDTEPGDVIRGPEGPIDEEARETPYGPPSPRSGTSQLDDKTSRVDDLQYNSAFDPSVFPYKRNVVQNQIRREDGDYRSANASEEVRRVPVPTGGEGTNEDTFWGSFLVHAQPDELHPIPSVAPSQRILRVESEPSVEVQVLRDGADNYFVRLPHDGLVRINMKIAAPQFYFAGQFGGDVGWADFAGLPGPGLDQDVRPVAERVARHIGVSSEMAPKKVLRELIYHYRNFETKELPEEARTGDLYETLSTEQVGVCRHRSLAFVVTAQAFGIPARYVTNEAHAFTEVYWPNRGWRRVDLGGAAREIGYNGGRDDRLHESGGRDPLPKPPKYREELRSMRGQGSGGDGETSGNARNREDNDGQPEQSSQRTSDGESSSRGRANNPSESSSGAESNGAGDPAEATGRDRSSDSASTESSGSSTGDPPDPGEARERVQEALAEQVQEHTQRGTQLTLRTDARSVFRGSDVTVHGRLRTNDGQPVSGRTVAILFGRVGAEATQMQRIGTAETGEDGEYQTTVAIPETTGIGRWSMIAVFSGDDRYRRATAK